MPNGGTLTITAGNFHLDETHLPVQPNAKPGPYVLLEVRDTGEGIPQENIHKIFDPFFTTKEAGKGTGLGLSTVIGIVKSHGGFADVHSEIAKGSTFQIYLPAAPRGETEEMLKERPVIQGGSGETILVVDDEAAIISVTEAILKESGYHVLTASNGVEAISLYARHSATIKAVLTDVMMPVMDGVCLIGELKKVNPLLKVICATGQTDGSRQSELKALDVNIFLQKPFTTEMLLGAVHDLIHGQPRMHDGKPQ